MSSTLDIAVIGSGSRFSYNLVRAIFQNATSQQVHLKLMDTDPDASSRVHDLVSALNMKTGKRHTASVHANVDDAVSDANHVLCSFATDFPASFLRTCWVMQDHGIDFVEGETATPGALIATLRHLPPLLQIARQARSRGSAAWIHVINNPMPRLLMGLDYALGDRRVIGHCHGTIHLRDSIAALFGLEGEECDIAVAGINHFHIVQKLMNRNTGADLIAALGERTPDIDSRWADEDYTQYMMHKELGYLIGHGIWHNYDYLPYANKRLWRNKHYNTWPRNAVVVLAKKEQRNNTDAALDVDRFFAEKESEQIFDIMLALSGVTGPYQYMSGNARNDGRLPFLPDDAIVELPSVVSQDRIELLAPVGDVPIFFQQWLATQCAIHRLSVMAAMGDRRAAIEAIALDPTFRAADCAPATLLDDMLAVNSGLVPELHDRSWPA